MKKIIVSAKKQLKFVLVGKAIKLTKGGDGKITEYFPGGEINRYS